MDEKTVAQLIDLPKITQLLGIQNLELSLLCPLGLSLKYHLVLRSFFFFHIDPTNIWQVLSWVSHRTLELITGLS